MRKYLIAYLIFQFSFFLPVEAQDSTYLLPDATIQSNRIQDKIKESGKSISILTKKDIQAAPVQSLQDVLQYALGIELRSRSFPFVQSDISIRGGSFDQVLILVDGIKLNDSQTGHHAGNVPVPIDLIERIEVVKGPGTRIYGPNAYAGVINIITKEGNGNRLKVGAYGGNYGAGGVNLAGSFMSGDQYHLVGASKDFGQGHKPNTDYTVDHFYYKNNFKFGTQEFHFNAGFTERKFGANGFYASPSFIDQYEEVQTSFVALQHQLQKGNWVLKSNMYWRRNQDLFLLRRNDPLFFRNFHLGNNVGVESNFTHQNDWGTTAVGLDLRKEFLHSTNLGPRQRDVFSLAAEHQFAFLNKKLLINPGFLCTYYSDHGLNFLPGVDLNYSLMQNINLYAALGNTLRVPTYTDLYYMDPTTVGNANLEAERALSLDVGVRWMKEHMSIQTTYFQRNSDNIIDWLQGNDMIWYGTNIENVNFSGLEAEFIYQIASNFNKVEVLPIRLQYTYVQGNYSPPEGLVSRYRFNHLRNQFQFASGIAFNKWLQLSGNIRHHDPFMENLDSYTLVDVKIIAALKNIQVIGEVVNATNQEFFGANGTEMPGSIWRIGMDARF